MLVSERRDCQVSTVYCIKHLKCNFAKTLSPCGQMVSSRERSEQSNFPTWKSWNSESITWWSSSESENHQAPVGESHCVVHSLLISYASQSLLYVLCGWETILLLRTLGVNLKCSIPSLGLTVSNGMEGTCRSCVDSDFLLYSSLSVAMSLQENRCRRACHFQDPWSQP